MSSSWLLIDGPVLWPVLLAMAVIAVLIVRELFKESSKRRLFNIVFSVLAVASLLMIYLKPKIPAKNQTNITVLVTKGYTEEVLDSLDKIYEVNFYDSLSYAEKSDVFRDQSVLIIGNGIPSADVPLWRKANAQYLNKSKRNHGVTKIKHQINRVEGELLTIDGRLFRDQPISLLLKDKGYTIDSLHLEKGENNFRLQTPLRSSGRYVYNVEEHTLSGQMLSSGELPVIVRNPSRLKILMINTFPTFEQKYLKNFLVDEGHALTVRSQLTKGKFKYEYYNVADKVFRGLTSEFLSTFDVLIIDHATLKKLPRNQSTTIKKSIESGLGLMVLPDENAFTSEDELVPINFTHTGKNAEIVTIDSARAEVQTYPFAIDPSFGQHSVIEQLAAYRRLGLGKVGVHVLRNTYQLVLEGKADFYQKLWIKQLQHISRADKVEQIENDWLALVDYPIEINVSGIEEPAGIAIDESTLTMIQDVHRPTKWQATYWPRATGWHTISLPGGPDSSFLYTQTPDNWRALQIQDQKELNLHTFNRSDKRTVSQRRFLPINLWWFYLLFLISVGYLWLEPKLS